MSVRINVLRINLTTNLLLKSWYIDNENMFWKCFYINMHIHIYETESVSCSVISDFLQPHTPYSPPGSSVHGILQARILESVAIPFSRRSSQPRDQTQVFHIAGRLFTVWATREPNYKQLGQNILQCTEGYKNKTAEIIKVCHDYTPLS